LARDQVFLGNIELFVLGVARQLDDLHAVLQRHRDAAQGVRRGDEHHVAEVVVEVEIMIVEGVVLLGVEHLEQRSCRITAKVGAHLVDLVEQEQRVVAAHLLQALHDLAGQGADIGAAVAANLGLVAHAA
jgi:hypothetical protein